MKRVLSLTAFALAGALLMGAGEEKPVKRVGMVIELDGSKIGEYKALHASGNPGVRDLLGKYHMQIPLPGEESWAAMEQVYFNP